MSTGMWQGQASCSASHPVRPPHPSRGGDTRRQDQASQQLPRAPCQAGLSLHCILGLLGSRGHSCPPHRTHPEARHFRPHCRQPLQGQVIFHGHPRGVGARGAPGTQPVPLDNQMAKKRLHHFHPPDRTGPGHILLGGVGGNHQVGPALGPAIPGHGHPDTVRRLSLSSEHTRLPTSSLPPPESRSTQKEGGGSQNQSWLLLALSELERKPRCPAGRTLKSNPSLVHPGSQDRRGSVA